MNCSLLFVIILHVLVSAARSWVGLGEGCCSKRG